MRGRYSKSKRKITKEGLEGEKERVSGAGRGG